VFEAILGKLVPEQPFAAVEVARGKTSPSPAASAVGPAASAAASGSLGTISPALAALAEPPNDSEDTGCVPKCRVS